MRSAAESNRQLNMKHRRTSNAGFSLVELLIAVVILAIIVIPLLHMFVTSTNINVKSRQMLRATTVAQDIMEGLKAYTLEEVRTQFEPPEGASGDTYHYPSNGFYVLNTNIIQGGVREITDLETDGEEIYYFGIKNLKMQGGEYDAFIKLDASTYTESKAKDKTGDANAVHDSVFNGAFYAEIAGVSETNGGSSETDSSFHEDKDLSKAVLADIKRQIEGVAGDDDLSENWDEVKLAYAGGAGNIVIQKRTIHVLLADAGTNDVEGNPQCKATITFTYDWTYTDADTGVTYSSSDPGMEPSHGYAGVAGGEVDGVVRTFSSGNFYLFYYPIYASGMIDNIEFEINNPSDVFKDEHPLLKNIVLMKQIRSNVETSTRVIAPDMSDDELFAKESSYRTVVGLSSSGIGSIDDDKLTFKTNVQTNLSDQAKTFDPITGEIDRDDITGVAYNFPSGINPVVMSDNSNASSKVTNVIYDIEITVYETGAADHFTETNFENLEDVHTLANITSLD